MADARNYSPDTCAYCSAETWCEMRSNGKPQCRGCKAERFYTHVLYAPIGYRAIGWQMKALRSMYGTVQAGNGLRQYRRAYICVPKKNGKSFLVGGMPLYHLLMEDEFKPKAYGAAASKEQAGIVFQAAAELVNANPVLQDRLRILSSVKRIVRRDGAGFYQVLSADGDTADGIEPSLWIVDELHRWRASGAQILYNVLTKGTISRREPLGIEITTAGGENESLLWESEHDLALKKLAGISEAKSFYAMVYSADTRRIRDDSEYWKSREARVAANPSHEDNGGFLKDEAIVEELDKAIADPTRRNDYLRFHLNIRTTSNIEGVIDIHQWAASAGDVDLRTWPEYDAELLVRKWGLLERTCVAGVDASWTNDLTAVSAVFPPNDADRLWRLLLWFWMPSERVLEFERKHQVPYSDWIKRGFIAASPGNAIDQGDIMQRIRWCSEMFELREVAYDPWSFRNAAMELEKDSITCTEVRQNFGQLSAATKKLLSLYPDKLIAHGNNPVMNWNAACLAVQGDRKDNVQPSKPERLRTAKRIDGISATVTAMSRAMLLPAAIDLDSFLDSPVRF